MIRVSSNTRLPLQAGQARMDLSSSSIMLPPGCPGPRASAAGVTGRSATERGAEPLDGPAQPLVDVHPRLPAQQGAGARDVRLADARVVLGQRHEHDWA